MSKADYYRKRHLELKKQESQEEPWSQTLLVLGAFVASALIWLTLFLVLVPRL